MPYSYRRFFPYDRESRPQMLDTEVDTGFFGKVAGVPVAVMRQRSSRQFYAKVMWPQSVNEMLETYIAPVIGEESAYAATGHRERLLAHYRKRLRQARTFVIVTAHPQYNLAPLWTPRTPVTTTMTPRVKPTTAWTKRTTT